MGAYQDAVQGAVVCLIAVMGALLDSTFNALVCVTVHDDFLLLFQDGVSMAGKRKNMQISFIEQLELPLCKGRL